MSAQNKSSQKGKFFDRCRNFSSEINLWHDVFRVPSFAWQFGGASLFCVFLFSWACP
jgi:hypothetical protein